MCDITYYEIRFIFQFPENMKYSPDNPLKGNVFEILQGPWPQSNGSYQMILSNEDRNGVFQVSVNEFDVISDVPYCVAFEWENKSYICFPGIRYCISCKSYKALLPKTKCFFGLDRKNIGDFLFITLLKKDKEGNEIQSTFYLSLGRFLNGDVLTYNLNLSRWSREKFEKFREFYEQFEAEKLNGWTVEGDDRPMFRYSTSNELHFAWKFAAKINSRLPIEITVSKDGVTKTYDLLEEFKKWKKQKSHDKILDSMVADFEGL